MSEKETIEKLCSQGYTIKDIAAKLNKTYMQVYSKIYQRKTSKDWKNNEVSIILSEYINKYEKKLGLDFPEHLTELIPGKSRTQCSNLWYVVCRDPSKFNLYVYEKDKPRTYSHWTKSECLELLRVGVKVFCQKYNGIRTKNSIRSKYTSLVKTNYNNKKTTKLTF